MFQDTFKSTLSKRIAATASAACVAAAFGLTPSAHAVTFNFDTDANNNAIATGEVIDYEYQPNMTVYTYNNRTPESSYGVAATVAMPIFNGNALVISESSSFSGPTSISPATPEQAGGHFIFAFNQDYNAGSLSLYSGGGTAQLQFVDNGSLVGVQEVQFDALGLSLTTWGDFSFDTLAVAFSGGGALDDLTVSNEPINVVSQVEDNTRIIATPEPITATLGLMGLTALTTTCLGRRRK